MDHDMREGHGSVVTVPRRETVHVEKRRFREAAPVNRYVAVPEPIEQRRTVQVLAKDEIRKEVPCKQVCPVPKEVVKKVTRKDIKIIEKENRLPGKRIEIPKVIDVVKELIVPRYEDTTIPTLVAQTIIPYLTPAADPVRVEATVYEPEVFPLDIYIPKPVKEGIQCDGKFSENLREVEVPAPQYNLILRHLNAELMSIDAVYRDMPFRAEPDGSVHFLTPATTHSTAESLSSMAVGIPLRHLATTTPPAANINTIIGSPGTTASNTQHHRCQSSSGLTVMALDKRSALGSPIASSNLETAVPMSSRHGAASPVLGSPAWSSKPTS